MKEFKSKSEIRKIFAERLKNLRKSQKIKIEDIVNELGITRQAYGCWERGTIPSAEHIPTLCKILNVDPNYLFGYSSGLSVVTHTYLTVYLEQATSALKAIKEIIGENK